MALFKRLSDNFWSLVSPPKPSQSPTAARMQTPTSAPPNFKKPALPRKRRQSSSPSTRTNKSKASHVNDDSGIVDLPPSKRRRLSTPRRHQTPTPSRHQKPPSPSGSGRRQQSRMDSMDLDEPSTPGETGIEDDVSGLRIPSSSPWQTSQTSESFQDDSLVVDDEEYSYHEARKRTFDLPLEAAELGASPDELRAEGWGDDFIELKQRIVLRGREPLIPKRFDWDFSFLPKGLFCEDEEAFIRSLRGKHAHARLALDRLFQMGSYVRGGLLPQAFVTCEQYFARFIKQYIKWADFDSTLDTRRAVPVLALITKPASTPSEEIEAAARKSLQKLHNRWTNTFAAEPSIELSPASTTSVKLSHPIPQLWAILGSGPMALLAAYRPDREEEGKDIHIVAMFDFRQIPYDGWTTLTFAMIICHCRNVQVRIAEETGLGVLVPGEQEEKEDVDL